MDPAPLFSLRSALTVTGTWWESHLAVRLPEVHAVLQICSFGPHGLGSKGCSDSFHAGMPFTVDCFGQLVHHSFLLQFFSAVFLQSHLQSQSAFSIVDQATVTGVMI